MGIHYGFMSMTERAPSVPAWVELLADFLSTHEGVEAIRVDATARQVRLATLGPVDPTALQGQLNEVLRRLEEAVPSMAMRSASPSGLSLSQQEGLITLAKPACPTAPKFWKWREFEWPEAEAMERQSEAEWRALAVQAGLCGTALVAAWMVQCIWPEVPVLGVRGLFALSLISGGWDAAKDAGKTCESDDSTCISSCLRWPQGRWLSELGRRVRCCSSFFRHLVLLSITCCTARIGRFML